MHLLECPISLKVVQLRRLFDWTNMAAALLQFFGAARHPCIDVRGQMIRQCLILRITLQIMKMKFVIIH